MSTATSDEQSYWENFARTFWERCAHACSRMRNPPPPADDVFQTMVRCAQAVYTDLSTPWGNWWNQVVVPAYAQFRKLGPEQPRPTFRFFFALPSLDGLSGPRRALARTLWLLHSAYFFFRKSFLPQLRDGNFEAYHGRVKREINPAWVRSLGLEEVRYGLILNLPELVDRRLWLWEREFLAPLFSHVGINNEGTYNAIFVGDYGKTPFGVHIDSENVFHIPIVGPKAMRTWSPEFVAAHPQIRGTHDYEPYLEHSIYSVAEPGGFVYWPSRDWHIAEPVGTGLSVSIALSLLVRPDPRDISWRAADATDATQEEPMPEQLSVAKTIPIDITNMQSSVDKVPGDFDVGGLWGLDRPHAWLRYISSCGFIAPPAPSPTSRLLPGSEIKSTGGWPILYLEDKAQIWVAVDGHLAVLPKDEGVKKLIDLLNGGGRWTNQELVQAASASGKRDTVSEAIDEICRVRREYLETATS